MGPAGAHASWALGLAAALVLFGPWALGWLHQAVGLLAMVAILWAVPPHLRSAGRLIRIVGK